MTAKVCRKCGQSDFAPGGSCRPCRKAYVERYKAEGANIEKPTCKRKGCGNFIPPGRATYCSTACMVAELRQSYPLRLEAI
jgi:hypothetical protein